MTDNKNFYFSIISDTHVLSRDLMVDNKDFETFTKFDRKLLVESEALLKESLNLVDEKNSSYLLLTGDLTKDGEKASHDTVARILSTWKEKDPQRKIFILPGNHDINNSKAFDYRKNTQTQNISPKDFFKTYSFCFEDFDKLKLYKDSEIFKSYLESVNNKYARDEEASYYSHGYLSYMARINPDKKTKNGITIIALDTSIYSCDFESSHQDFKENVPGYLEENQMIWACNMIEEAKKRKDLILLIGHHAIIPNFRNQELVFGPFIIKNWAEKFSSSDKRVDKKTPIEVLADMQVKFIFTGHLHENGTAKFKSAKANEIFNIQTGSPVTYPLPIRHVRVFDDVKDYSGFSLDIQTELITSFSFTKLNGERKDVDNAIIYTLENQLSLKDVIFNYVRTLANKPEIYNLDIKKIVVEGLSGFLDQELPDHGYINELFPKFLDKFPKIIKNNIHINITLIGDEFAFAIRYRKSVAWIKASSIEDALENIFDQIERKILIKPYIVDTYDLLVKKVLSMPLDENGEATLYDFANYLYQYKPVTEGEDDRPEFVDDFIEKLKNPDYDIIDEVLSFTEDEINQVYDWILTSLVFKKDGSKKKFFDDLFVNRGLISMLVKIGLIARFNNMKDVVDVLARPILKKKNIKGVDLASYILHNRKVTRARNKFTAKMFGTGSVRKYVIDLIMSMSNQVTDYYLNDDLNALDHYFNYIEYDEYEI